MSFVTVLYFAKVRSIVGISREQFSFSDDHATTVQEIIDNVLKAHPALEKIILNCAISKNEEYVQRTQSVQNGDTIAIIPPVSGG